MRIKRNSSNYLMEHSLEAKRLSRKANPDDFIDRYIGRLIAERSGMRKNGRLEILDVGCGSGSVVSKLAKRYPRCSIYGVDLNAARFHDLQKNCCPVNLTFVEADARQLHFEDNKFDVVFSRFLLEYMSDPSLVISEMIRVARRGGFILLQDLDGQLLRNYPIDICLRKKINRVVNYLKQSGFDPYVGRKLFFLAKKNGLRKTKVFIEPYHLIAGKITNENYLLWDMKLEIAKPHIAQALGSKNAAILFKKEYLRYLSNEHTLTYSDLITVVGKKGL